MWNPAKYRTITHAEKRNALNIESNTPCLVNGLLCIPKLMYAFDVNVIVPPYPFCRATIAIIPSSAYEGGIVKIRLVVIWYLGGTQLLLLWWAKWKTSQNWFVFHLNRLCKSQALGLSRRKKRGKKTEKKTLLVLFFLSTEWGSNLVDKKMVHQMPVVQSWVSPTMQSYTWHLPPFERVPDFAP